MNIAIGSDHAGYEYKSQIIKKLEEWGYKVNDFGPYSSESVDYPDFAHPVAISVQSGDSHLGVLICGSGNGVCMSANKHTSIRAALCWTKELAQLARQHNNANVICIPSRFISKRMATDLVKMFITTEFEGGRHALRVDKISCI